MVIMGISLVRAIFIILGLVCIGFIALIYSRYLGDIHQAQQRIRARSQIATTPAGTTEYAVDGGGPPVLIAHGAGGGFDQGLDFSRAFIKSGFRVIAVSRFGYLRTPLPSNASPSAQADIYACLLDLLDIPRVTVIGFSAGAPSSMQFALRYPERTNALVLLVPAAYPTHLEQRTDGAVPKQTSAGAKLLFDSVLKSDLLLWAAFRIAPRTMYQALLGTPPEVIKNASTDEQGRMAQVLNHLLPFSSRIPGVINDATITPYLPRYELERIEAPVLIVGAADDLYGTYDGARYSAEHIPRARFIGYPSGGHALVGHQSDALSEVIAFLETLSAKAAMQ